MSAEAASRGAARVVAGAASHPATAGMVIAHLGFAACVTGIVATSQYSVEHDLKMSPGDTR